MGRLGGQQLDFEAAYLRFMRDHTNQRNGERLRRLKEGHNHAERLFAETVWWPIFHQFEGLHPEYEVRDYRQGNYFLDFAYIQPSFLIALEIDGYGSHVQKLSRHQHSLSLRRQNLLICDGWHVLRFSYDDVKDAPRICQQSIQLLLGRLLAQGSVTKSLQSLAKIREREIMRLVISKNAPITASEVCQLLSVHQQTAHRLLRNLAAKQWLDAASGNHRVRSYGLHPSKSNVYKQ